jgi:hypothetical protein
MSRLQEYLAKLEESNPAFAAFLKVRFNLLLRKADVALCRRP